MKIYYVHGIGSSGGGNTVELLKKYYPDYEIISDDIPTDPIAAFMTINMFGNVPKKYRNLDWNEESKKNKDKFFDYVKQHPEEVEARKKSH